MGYKFGSSTKSRSNNIKSSQVKHAPSLIIVTTIITIMQPSLGGAVLSVGSVRLSVSVCLSARDEEVRYLEKILHISSTELQCLEKRLMFIR